LEQGVNRLPASLDCPTAARRTWDCVVIGGGPAGALAARQCALRGLATLLVERRAFPRYKVCGACINVRSLSVLASAGLEKNVRALCGARLRRLSVRSAGHVLELPLPGGMSISRARFDEVLVRTATEAGAAWLPETQARVLSLAGPGQPARVQLRRCASTAGNDPWSVEARTVVAADGLGHPSLPGNSFVSSNVAGNSRFGAGAVLAPAAYHLESGTIQLALARGGYVGIVRLEDGAWNVAAALEAGRAGRHTSLPSAIESILSEAGAAPLGGDGVHWQGTPRLTRTVSPVSRHGLFLVGDGAGYVEPFTGEGIAWALDGGVRVVPSVERALNGDLDGACRMWRSEFHRSVRRRQTWCRRFSWLSKRPALARTAMAMCARWPGLARPVIHRLNQPLLAPLTKSA